MNPASQPDADAEHLARDVQRALSSYKPVWQRFLIVLAGPVANFLLAIADLRGLLRGLRHAATRRRRSARSQPGSAAAAGRPAAGRPDRRDRRAATIDRSRTSAPDRRRFGPSETVDHRFERGGRPCEHARRRIGARERDATSSARAIAIGLLGVRRRPSAISSGCPSSKLFPQAIGYTVDMTRIDDRRARPDRHRPALAEGTGRAAQDRPDRRAAGEPRLRSSSSSCSRCFRLIWDSSTSCQSRCSMADILFSTRPRQSGGARSACGHRNGRFAAGSRCFSRCCFSPRSTILASFGLFERLGRLIG